MVDPPEHRKPTKADVRAKFTNAATLTTIYLTNDNRIVVHRRLGRSDGGPVAGAVAEVEAAGNIAARTTATRNLFGGGILGQKKIDARETYLSIVGNGWSVVEKVEPMVGKLARKFAAEVNAAARQVDAPTQAVAAATAQNPADLLADLARLRDSGVLTADEFDAKKVEILGRL